MNEVCATCKHALKRSPYSYQYYGAIWCPFECMMVESNVNIYKERYDSCDKWESKGEQCTNS